MKKFFTKPFILVALLTLIGGFLHFYNLNWGAPFYFHPDERNIASAVAQLQFPRHMNPQFFAYGSLPIYTIYFTGYITNYILSFINPGPNTLIPTFSQAILISRVYSALFATLLIPLLFSLGKKLKNETAGLLSAFFATASTGFIQFAHFGTFEIWLTFFGTLLFWSCLNVIVEKKMTDSVLLSLIFGVLVSVKVSSLALMPIPIFALAVQALQLTGKTKRNNVLSLMNFLRNLCLFLFIVLTVFIITNPFVLLDTKDFQSSMNYESGVAIGTQPVFYTGNFLDTIPVVYQLLHVYPFLLNPLMTVLFIPSLIYLLTAAVKQKNKEFFLLTAFFIFLFVPQAFLYVKWTRYMMPTLPFMMLIIALALSVLFHANRHLMRLLKMEIAILIILNSIVALSYFKIAFMDLDSRITAVLLTRRAIPLNATILSEPADLGVLPFQDALPHLDTFNFYELDNNSLSATQTLLQQKIATSQYIILPSQRILQSRIENPQKFPKGSVFYKTLLDGRLGFKKIYETPCDVFCTIVYLGDPVYWWEQTASVFDRPTVMIFKKTS